MGGRRERGERAQGGRKSVGRRREGEREGGGRKGGREGKSKQASGPHGSDMLYPSMSTNAVAEILKKGRAKNYFTRCSCLKNTCIF